MTQKQERQVLSTYFVKQLIELRTSQKNKTKRLRAYNLIQSCNHICISPGFGIGDNYSPQIEDDIIVTKPRTRKRKRKYKKKIQVDQNKLRWESALSKIKSIPQDMENRKHDPTEWSSFSSWCYNLYIETAKEVINGKYTPMIRKVIRSVRPWISDNEIEHVISYWEPEDLAQEVYIRCLYYRRLLGSELSIARRMSDIIKSSVRECIIREYDISKREISDFTIQRFLFSGPIDPYLRLVIYKYYTENKRSPMINMGELLRFARSELSKHNRIY